MLRKLNPHKLIFTLFLIISTISNAQCWKSLAIKGDTSSYIFAIRNDNTLWDFTTNSTGIQVGNQNIWEKCVSSWSANLLIAIDSSLWGWGVNYYGELGIGNTNNQPSIIQLNNSKWIDISTCGGITTAIKNDGTIWYWGTDSPNPTVLLPIQIGLDNDWKKVQSSYSNIIALKNNGTLWKGTPGNALLQIGTDTDWNYIWAEQDEWWAIKNNGTLWYNGAQVGNDNNWQSIIGHIYAGTHAVKTNGTLWYWPHYNPMTPGIVITFNPLTIPTQISTISNYNLISISNDNSSPLGASIYSIHDDDKLWFDKYSIDAPCNISNLGFQDIENESKLKLFPNPTKDKLNIISTEKIDSIEIYNSIGEKLFVTSSNGNKAVINVVNYVPGVYFLKIVSVTGSHVKQFSKAY